MSTLPNVTPILDKFAISISTICAIHCLALPILLSVFPALAVTIFGQESFHVLLLWFVIPLSLIALALGCRKHKDRWVAVLGFAGLTFLIVAASLGHDILGEDGERIATLIGAIAIASGHLRNYTLCRRVTCDQ